MLYEFLATPKKEHRKRLVSLIVLIAVAIIIMIVAFLMRGNVTDKNMPSPMNEMARRQALLSQPNPMVNLSAEESALRQKVLNQTNPTTKLTTDEIQKRQALLQNF